MQVFFTRDFFQIFAKFTRISLKINFEVYLHFLPFTYNDYILLANEKKDISFSILGRHKLMIWFRVLLTYKKITFFSIFSTVISYTASWWTFEILLQLLFFGVKRSNKEFDLYEWWKIWKNLIWISWISILIAYLRSTVFAMFVCLFTLTHNSKLWHKMLYHIYDLKETNTKKIFHLIK